MDMVIFTEDGKPLALAEETEEADRRLKARLEQEAAALEKLTGKSKQVKEEQE